MFRSHQTETPSVRTLTWAVMVIAGALLACTGVTTYTPDADQPGDQLWETEREPDESSESKILCCDGTLAESCPCTKSSKGCCTNHEGVCGCRRGDTSRNETPTHP